MRPPPEHVGGGLRELSVLDAMIRAPETRLGWVGTQLGGGIEAAPPPSARWTGLDLGAVLG
ncbi:hypothetical protein [Amycolatopsis coloradensis]|uniref:hypothetical protein n=1 Tax=Amycolatopsis coloradensis TaxID=76021 RepID=UPI0011775E3D|nr:hypothetical protein [Amycolatopsis coloradensis]